MNCNFYEGIDTCKEQKCDKNIMGMCTKKGSKNYPDVPHRTQFERIKLMSVDEIAEFLNSTTGQIALKLNDKYVLNDKASLRLWLESEV